MSAVSTMLRQRPVQLLLASNLVPVIGALLFGGGVSTLVLLYVFETVLLILIFAAKVATNTQGKTLHKIVFLPLFTVGYLVVVAAILGFTLVTFYTGHHDGPTFLSMSPDEHLALLIEAVRQEGGVLVAACLVGFLVTHLQSFVRNYLRGGGHAQNLELLVFKPILRIVLVVVVVIPGGALLYFEGSTWYFVVALAVVKIGADLAGHWTENRKAYQAAAAGGEAA